MATAFLDDRGVVEVEGADARALLQRLVTNDVATLRPGEARYAALLSPQGKILADFLVHDVSAADGADCFLLDCPAALAGDLARKLALYRLRAAVRIIDLSADRGVTAHWPEGPGARDPRHHSLGTRAIGIRVVSDGSAADVEARALYEAHRLALGIPDGGRDFAYGDAFPHDANLDRLNGVDFGKGCYVGQEVVSRVHHRGTARKRIVPVTFLGQGPAAGSDIAVGEIAIGTMGSSVPGHGLAMVRLDRALDALALGAPAVANGVQLSLALA